MNKTNIDKYDILLDLLGYKYKKEKLPASELSKQFDSVRDLIEELGIFPPGIECDLVIWNDDVNDMMHVTLALYEICELNNEESMSVMLKAHDKGKSIAKSGAVEDLIPMTNKLKERNIIASIQIRNPYK